MAITVNSAALVGIDAMPISVEVDLLRRLPRVAIVGLAAVAVQETAERVRSAITATGIEFPRTRIIVNLSPADVRKDGPAFDLPIAVGILAAASDTDWYGAFAPERPIPSEALNKVLLVGELTLSGELRSVRGVLSIAKLAASKGLTLILPADQAEQAALIPGVDARGARTLSDVIDHLRGVSVLPRALAVVQTPETSTVDLADVRGNIVGRRALEIAAAGGFTLLLQGPPGCGKSMLARRLTTILPPLTDAEALETTCIHDVAGLRGSDSRICGRPFRAPHHTVTVAGLVGDRRLRPGEVSLAHNGVLFLDEAPEFPRAVLEVLRVPVAEKVVRLVRAEGNVTYPANIALVLASNLCPCGRKGSTFACACTEDEAARYRRRVDPARVDMSVTLTPPSDLVHTEYGEPSDPVHMRDGESSAAVRERVIAARQFATDRGSMFHPTDSFLTCESAAQAHIARTIADLAGSETIGAVHFAEAATYTTHKRTMETT